MDTLLWIFVLFLIADAIGFLIALAIFRGRAPIPDAVQREWEIRLRDEE